MLSSGVREILATAEAVIVDEIHAVAQTKRGSHLALTLERLESLASETRRRRRLAVPRRSRAGRAADRALGDAAAAGADRAVPRRPEAGVRDRRCGAAQGARPGDRRPGRGHGRPGLGAGRRPLNGPGRRRPRRRADRPRAELRPPTAPPHLAGDLPGAAGAGPGTHLDDHLRQQPPRRRAPRQAPQRAGRDEERRSCRRPSTRPRPPADERGEPLRDRPRPPRLALARGADPRRGAAEVGRAALPRRHLLARAGDRHGRRRPRDPGRVAEVGDPRAAADRPRRARRWARSRRAGSSPSSAATCSSARSSPSACARARSRRR